MIDIIVVIAVIIIIVYFAGKNIEDARKYDDDPLIDEIYRDYEAKLYPKKEKKSSSGSKDTLDIPTTETKFSREFYLAHLCSEKFRRLKEVRLFIDEFKCKQCGIPITMETSHCHHITYSRLGAEKYSDLVSVCPRCHNEIHEFHGKNAKYYPILKK